MQEQKYAIKDWAKDDRPREKLLTLGPARLSNAELLAILIRKGNRHKNALELAKDVMRLAKDNAAYLGKLSVEDIRHATGLGEVAAISLVAALELGRRRQVAELGEKKRVMSSRDAAEWLQIKLKDLPHEVFGLLLLNKANKILHFEIVSEGGITATIVDPRIIFKKALTGNATSMILCHNHPSGSLKPSRADEELTQKLVQAASLLDIRVLDHLIVSESGYYSFADEGLI
ncbi:DNA repair protein RadC [Nostoc ellipsosporum NOK]|jgi:DNA repair protein RadC|nr:DNA repair protein RadC [Nostoc ellipsosporum NOK]